MGMSTIKEARAFKMALNLYTKTTGQLINWSKSSPFFINTLEERQRKIAKILDCNISSFPSSYLGLPLGPNINDSFWNQLVERFYSKLAGWKGACYPKLVRSLSSNPLC
jgi:hypothetical protein